MEKKHLMIIGAGVMQIPVITAARQMGLITIVTDYNKDAYGLKLADYPIIMSTKDIEGSVRVAKTLNEKVRIDGVITVGTDASMTVAAVANALGLPGIKFENAEAASNKIKMRKRFKENGVPCPDFFVVWTYDEAVNSFEKLKHPVVLKPSDNMGARGVIKVNSREEILEAFKFSKGASPSGELIMEEYMEGPELSIDALIYKNEIYFTGIADRIIEYPPYFVETGHVMPSNLPQPFIDNALDVMRKGIKALGIDLGAAKGDIKITGEGAKIGELAARLSGGYMSGFTFPYSSGINLMKNAIEIALGQKPSDLVPKQNYVSIERAIIPQSGIVTEIFGVEEALTIEGVKNVFINVKVGEEVFSLTSNLGKSGNVIVVGKSRDEAMKIANSALDQIHVITREHIPITMEEVRKRALEKFNKSCYVCKVCDGKECRGQVPGMGGVGTGKSFSNNLKSIEKYQMVMSYIHPDVEPNTKTNLFGKEISMPIIAAPVTGTSTNMGGGMDEFDYNMAVLSGSKISKTVAMIGDGASAEKYKIGLEAITKTDALGIPIFKPRTDQNEIIKRIKAAEDAGAFAVGCDIDAIAFITMKLKNQSVEGKSIQKIQELIKSSSLPFVIKGVMTVKDAKAAIECGANAIIISNHGGRVLDNMPGAMDVLSEIVDAVKDKLTVMVDGGFRNGEDIFKALALGADIVCIGRPVSICAYGGASEGVSLLFETMKGELTKVMKLNGLQQIKEIDRTYLKLNS